MKNFQNLLIALTLLILACCGGKAFSKNPFINWHTVSSDYSFINQMLDSSLNSRMNDSFDVFAMRGCLFGNCKDGIGKFVNSNLTYTGEWRDGKKNGKGECKWLNGNIFDGEWKDDHLLKGKLTFKDGDIYDGEWKNNKREGKGKYTFKDGDIYDGEWKNDKYEGKGKLTFKDGEIYDGEWKNDKYDGKGKATYSNSNIYIGEWKNGKREGKGKYTFKDGSVYIGEWKNDKYEGKGKLTKPTGEVFSEDWVADDYQTSNSNVSNSIIDSTKMSQVSVKSNVKNHPVELYVYATIIMFLFLGISFLYKRSTNLSAKIESLKIQIDEIQRTQLEILRTLKDK